MKIFSNQQIRAADAYTIENEPIASIDLMERASQAFVEQFAIWFDSRRSVKIVCGTGNNGGDGLAIARLLHKKKYNVAVLIIRSTSADSQDFQANYQRIPEEIDVLEIRNEDEIPTFFADQIIIDALFGSGLSRPITGVFARAIFKMNASNAIIVAIDIASGLMTDEASKGDAIIKPAYTITFQFPKKSFLFPENDIYVGKWVVVPIGLSPRYIEKTDTDTYLTTKTDISAILKPRPTHSHKGNYGRVLLIVGSYGKIGAGILSSKASLRTGTGLLTVHIPECGYKILQATVPEAMVSVDDDSKFITTLPDISNYNVIGIGPGLDTKEKTAGVVKALLQKSDKPIVIDADALNIIAEHKALLDLIPPGSILTPHAKEFKRIAGNWENGFERLELQKGFSIKYNVNVVFKGAYTTVTSWDGLCFFNSTGNPGMATAGSGDVLTGIITSLLGQEYTSIDAAKLGVYLHGLAGDMAANELGQHALIASDLIAYLPKGFQAFKL